MNDITEWEYFYEHTLPLTLIVLCALAIIASGVAVALLVKRLFK